MVLEDDTGPTSEAKSFRCPTPRHKTVNTPSSGVSVTQQPDDHSLILMARELPGVRLDLNDNGIVFRDGMKTPAFFPWAELLDVFRCW